jgi:two-component system, OmpR family, sensor kinase
MRPFGGPPCQHPHHWHRHLRHRRRHWRENLRHYTGAHLRRRLFLWFGAAIFVTVAVVWGTARLTRSLGDGPPSGLLYGILPVFALWVLSGKIARRIARPLDELVDVSTAIGRGNLGARAELACGGLDEIAILARSINDMAGRIERQIADQRELLAGVSHELRTPLARLRVLLDIARDQGPSRKTWDDLERELLEMDQLVGELLASARLDFQALAPRPLDALDAARRALERAGQPADKLDSALPAAPFSGDPTLVGRALANLLDNAVKYGSGLDRLVVASRPGFVVFEVRDRGPGFSPELLERLFHPFVRGVEGQAGAPSLGLGLALVARIARAHGGSVRASNQDGGGAQLVLELAERPPPQGTSDPVSRSPTGS